LVFAIRGAFKRREKALEFLSLHRGAIKTISYYFMNSAKLSDEAKKKINEILNDLSNSFLDHLSQSNYSTDEIDRKTALIYQFIEKHNEELSGGTKQKIFRFIKDVHVSQENLIAIHTHRTPISLKAYCLIFIYMFPVIYTPTIINKIGLENPMGLTYFVIILSEFILISLYNIQDQMEYPFDKDGLDDIKLDYFKVNRSNK
jgi:predicted membrane chloride channel (bestrophin family)